MANSWQAARCMWWSRAVMRWYRKDGSESAYGRPSASHCRREVLGIAATAAGAPLSADLQRWIDWALGVAEEMAPARKRIEQKDGAP